MSPRLLALLFCTLSAPLWAASSDRNKPIEIEADRVDINERQGLSSYQGNVVMRQGSIRMRADSIVVKTENRALISVKAQGRPANFSQRPDNASADVQAQAQNVDYQAQKGLLVLTSGARFQQGVNQFSGNRIEYDMQQNIVSAQGSEQGPSSRVQVIIHPDTLEQ